MPALGTQLRTKFKPRIEDYKIYRIYPGGDTEFLHPKDGVFSEKVNEVVRWWATTLPHRRKRQPRQHQVQRSQHLRLPDLKRRNPEVMTSGSWLSQIMFSPDRDAFIRRFVGANLIPLAQVGRRS